MVYAVTGNDSGDDGTKVNTSKNASSSGAAGNSNELLDRLSEGAKATYHVRYVAGDDSGPHAVLEVWHSKDKVRRDVTVTGSTGETTRTEEFLKDGNYVRCVLLEGHPWQCVAAPASQATLQDPLNGAASNARGKDVTVTSETIAGHSVKCYTVEPGSSSAKPAKFCLSDDNVPLSIDGGDGKPTTASNYDLTVSDSVFTYPATVAGLTTPTTATT